MYTCISPSIVVLVQSTIYPTDVSNQCTWIITTKCIIRYCRSYFLTLAWNKSKK